MTVFEPYPAETLPQRLALGDTADRNGTGIGGVGEISLDLCYWQIVAPTDRPICLNAVTNQRR
jgi:hypothetical protein